MDIVMTGPDGREHPLTTDPLRISYDPQRDLFEAVADGHSALAADPLADALFVRRLRFLIDSDETIVGFQILEFSAFNPEDGNLDILYTPQFDVPGLDLVGASAGEIIEAAQERFAGSRSAGPGTGRV